MGVVEVEETRDVLRSNSKRIEVPRPPSIEEFAIIKPISRGAFGKVYLARKKNNNSKLYAIKVVKKADLINKNMVHQVQAERDALALSKSPFIVHLYYSLQSANNVYLVMEYLIGGDVKSLLHIYGYFDEEMALKYISEVALALDYLHRHSIIHRDLKPDNMLISNEGHIKLTDFGLSKVTLNREINMTDILTTPSMIKPKRDYSRTPGQVLSLISSLGFHTPAGEKHRGSPLASPMSCDNSRLSQGSFSSPVAPVRKESVFCTPAPSTDKLLKSCPNNAAAKPVMCLTPTLLKSRTRFGTSSLSSQSHPCLSSAESECCSSPRWEKDFQDTEMALNSVNKRPASAANKPDNLSDNNETMGLKNVDLDSALSPVDGNGSLSRNDARTDSSTMEHTPPTANSGKANARKCLYDKKAWEAKKPLANGTEGAEEVTVFLSNQKSSQQSADDLENTVELNESSCTTLDATVPLDRAPLMDCSTYRTLPDRDMHSECGTYKEDICEKPSVKRGFELVDKSPVQDCALGKKNNCVYKRGYEISDCQESCNSGLTMEIHSLMLSRIKEFKNDGMNGTKDLKTSIAEAEAEEMSSPPAIAKNLLCELDKQCDKGDNREHLNSSFSSGDDKSLRRSLSLGSDSSVHEMSITENHFEKQLSDLDRSIKDLSFEDVQSDNRSSTPPCHQDGTLKTGNGGKVIQDLKEFNQESETIPKGVLEIHNDVWPSQPSLNIRPFILSKKKTVVAFRSFYSPINDSCTPLPTRMSIGCADAAEISSFSTGSYRVTATPAQQSKVRNSFSAFQTPQQKSGQTPYRTPKSVRRGVAPAEGEQFIGTPDYLAPELLLGKHHGSSVDWWALGVCLYEFLTGIPPFNDETPQQVFQNILNRDLTWPEGEEELSRNAQSAIDILLTIDCNKRAGLKGLQQHPFFDGVEWDNLQNQPMPFIPQPDDETDTTYFEARNNAQQLTVSGFSL